MPMFHGMGIMQIGWTVRPHNTEIFWRLAVPDCFVSYQAFSGLVLTVFKPKVPAVAPSPESVMKGAMDTNSDFIFCVPSFVEVGVLSSVPSCLDRAN